MHYIYLSIYPTIYVSIYQYVWIHKIGNKQYLAFNIVAYKPIYLLTKFCTKGGSTNRANIFGLSFSPNTLILKVLQACSLNRLIENFGNFWLVCLNLQCLNFLTKNVNLQKVQFCLSSSGIYIDLLSILSFLIFPRGWLTKLPFLYVD